MRIATFSDGRERAVAVEVDGVWRRLPAPSDDARAVVLDALRDPAGAVKRAGGPMPDGWMPIMPFAPVREAFCLGKNYREHAEEFARFNGDAAAVPADPIVFTKSPAAWCGPTDPLVVAPQLAGALDYEAELLVVIGWGGRAIRRTEALDHVGGYSVCNDTTARDLQRRHAQWYLGKSLPAASPWGPVVVTPDVLEPFDRCRIASEVNGEVRQDARLGQMIFSVADAIATISEVVALVPGDLIAMGTASGVGVGFDPPRYLGDGDEVRCWVEGIGELRNRIVVRSADTEAVAAS